MLADYFYFIFFTGESICIYQYCCVLEILHVLNVGTNIDCDSHPWSKKKKVTRFHQAVCTHTTTDTHAPLPKHTTVAKAQINTSSPAWVYQWQAAYDMKEMPLIRTPLGPHPQKAIIPLALIRYVYVWMWWIKGGLGATSGGLIKIEASWKWFL